MKEWGVLKMSDSNLTLWEHQIIEVQFEIDKFVAELEFHKQKSRMIADQLELQQYKIITSAINNSTQTKIKQTEERKP